MLCTRRADMCCGSLRAATLNIHACPRRTFGPQAAASSSRRIKQAKVPTAANVGAPLWPGDDGYVDDGVSDFISSTVDKGWDLQSVNKDLGNFQILRKYLPREKLVARVDDVAKFVSVDSGLWEGMFVGTKMLFLRGSAAAVEDYVLSLFDIASQSGEAYAIFQDQKRSFKYRVRRMPDFPIMLRSAKMNHVCGPTTK